MRTLTTLIYLKSFYILILIIVQLANSDAKRLYDDLINGYNRLVRPVGNNSEKLTVYMGLKLTQILDVVIMKQKFHLVFIHIFN